MTEKYPSIGVQKPSENHFDGPVYVLIDGGSFSATPAFTVLADYYKRATFVGEETGGVGSGGAGADIGPMLPESHLHFTMSMESYFLLVDKSNPRRGTLPKYQVTQTIDDLAKGRDTVLEFTRELIRSGKGR
jgi:C-terminal processing protease CtpA/Prc